MVQPRDRRSTVKNEAAGCGAGGASGSAIAEPCILAPSFRNNGILQVE